MTLPDPSKRTQRRPYTVNGVTFESYKTGISRYALFSTDGRACVSLNTFSKTGTYSATVDGRLIGKRYHHEGTAMFHAAQALKDFPQ